jgi:hypothetical protein
VKKISLFETEIMKVVEGRIDYYIKKTHYSKERDQNNKYFGNIEYDDYRAQNTFSK